MNYYLVKNYPNAIQFTDTKRWSTDELNILYNLADAQILLTSNEGWGLTLTEAMLAGNPYYSKCYRGDARSNEV